jgi:hypothetical protein
MGNIFQTVASTKPKPTYVWWVLMPPGSSEGSYLSPKIPDTAEIFKVVAGSTADITLQNGGTITILGKQWTPALVGSFPTQAAAKAAAPPAGLAALGSFVGSAVGGALLSGQPGNTNIVGQAAQAGQQAGNTAADFYASVTHFLSDLTHLNWLRIGEGILGVLLIATAVAHLAEGTPAGQLAKKLPLIM